MTFKKMILTDNYLVDKTMLIKELIEANDEVTLITRSRRFGKTMNMTMFMNTFPTVFLLKTAKEILNEMLDISVIQ